MGTTTRGILESNDAVQTIESVVHEPNLPSTSPASSLPETSHSTESPGTAVVDGSPQDLKSPPSTVPISPLQETSPSNRPSCSPATIQVDYTVSDFTENEVTTASPMSATPISSPMDETNTSSPSDSPRATISNVHDGDASLPAISASPASAQEMKEPSHGPFAMPQQSSTTGQTSPPPVETVLDPTVENPDISKPGEIGDDGSIPVADQDLTDIHVVFGDLHFRRVCARAFSSLLCMIMRLPFEMPLQDIDMSRPSPFDDRFYDIEGLDIIDGQALETCRNNSQTVDVGIDDVAKACLELAAAESPTRAKLIWTRQQAVPPEASQETTLYGSNEPGQYERLMRFFGGNHTIVVLGASPSPGVMFCILDLFGSCEGRRQHRDVICPGEEVSNSKIRLRVQDYFFSFGAVPSVTVPERMLEANITAFIRPNDGELQPLTVFAEFPFAHTQRQDLILNHWDQMVETETGLARSFMDVYSAESQEQFAALGFRLERLLAFDGFPQYFPTETGAYVDNIGESHTESEFVEKQGYPGWQPEYGTGCRGPIPPKSRQTACNQLERDAFTALGFDMRWYGRIREFANLMWFTIAGWRERPRPALDCTHAGGGGSGEHAVFYCVHKYMMLAMIDDYFDELERKRS